ncbi:C40 family peptidase [Quisquiliibacterium transsilvanicum]|uniref:Cell wall-associated NlpC family hydrolase n=1 Tax=Quisquiliibacterium transsilvanicum TaxID=1549638 RepID=A0A7W8HKL8_9BURK|nr:C40 family peptidase [Quisquiliibacterium transsilvanicum]MBB5273607.1 cell wall-associated NlpC family hydrolase [Quisquiliibacterium transsilvanicum]
MQDTNPINHSSDCQPAQGRRVALLGACAAALLSACSSLPSTGGDRAAGPPDSPTDWPGALTEDFAREVVFLALSLVDTPYRWGGNTPTTGFDCSGLIVHVFRGAAGVALPRTVAQLASVGRPVPRTQVRTADLVFFNATGRFSHAGIYVGGDRFVHAPSTGGRVRLDGIDARYWAPRLAAIRRV